MLLTVNIHYGKIFNLVQDLQIKKEHCGMEIMQIQGLYTLLMDFVYLSWFAWNMVHLNQNNDFYFWAMRKIVFIIYTLSLNQLIYHPNMSLNFVVILI